MTDSLRRIQDRTAAPQKAGGGKDAQPDGWWQSMDAAARAGALSALFLFVGTFILIVGVVSLVTVFAGFAAGTAAGLVVAGIALFVIGVLFGLDNS